jgi:hypothetical protein
MANPLSTNGYLRTPWRILPIARFLSQEDPQMNPEAKIILVNFIGATVFYRVALHMCIGELSLLSRIGVGGLCSGRRPAGLLLPLYQIFLQHLAMPAIQQLYAYARNYLITS